MVRIQRAVTDIRGCNLERIGPTDSAEKRFTSFRPNIGNTATVKNTIPKPPTQCVIIRQKSIDLGNDSISCNIVAPVVVKPDIVSKKASVKPVMLSVSIYGSVPKSEKTTQHIVTTT